MSEGAPDLGVLFDLDGTLVDSLPTVAAAMSRTLADFGYDFAPEVVLPLIGAPMPVLAAELTGVTPEVAEQMNTRYLELYYDEFIETTRPLEGAEALLERLCDAGIKLAVVTNKNEDGALRMVEIQRWGRFFIWASRPNRPRSSATPNSTCRPGGMPGWGRGSACSGRARSRSSRPRARRTLPATSMP